jgi:transposase
VVRKAAVRRSELTDGVWERIAPLLPENGRRGKQWKDHRTVINGILWKLRTGAPWRDLPERYGSWQTCYDRFARWRRDGTWDRLLARAQTKSDAVGEVEWEVRKLAPSLRGPALTRDVVGNPLSLRARAHLRMYSPSVLEMRVRQIRNFTEAP